MSYKQEFSNININILSSGIYNKLSENNQLVSTDFYFVGEEGQNKRIMLGKEKILDVQFDPSISSKLSSEEWTFTLSNGDFYTRNVVFSM